MYEDHQESVPLIGALLVAEGLVTMEQLEECLWIQAHDLPGMPIGQILVRRGYLAAEDCRRMLAVQQDVRWSLCDAFEVCLGG